MARPSRGGRRPIRMHAATLLTTVDGAPVARFADAHWMDHTAAEVRTRIPQAIADGFVVIIGDTYRITDRGHAYLAHVETQRQARIAQHAAEDAAADARRARRHQRRTNDHDGMCMRCRGDVDTGQGVMELWRGEWQVMHTTRDECAAHRNNKPQQMGPLR